jgi:hypothetical protein
MDAQTLPRGLWVLCLLAAPAAAETPAECLDCHGDLWGAFFALGEDAAPAWLDAEALAGSVHGELWCGDCHRDRRRYPHPLPASADARSYRIERAQSCARCHARHASWSRDGIHFQRLSLGAPNAPTCVDCHGAHAVAPARVPHAEVRQSCGRCHEDQVQAWEGSAHGRAARSGDLDAPTCADCHGAHDIGDPADARAHAASYTVCAPCHGDAEMMARHDLDARVVDSYLVDFHGASNRIFRALNDVPERPVATCGDCHGVHAIQGFADGTPPGGAPPGGTYASAAAMCRSCHEGAPDGFVTAWGSHRPPSESHRPLVWWVNVIYKVLIPLMIIGLVAHIILDLWRIPGHRREGRS